MTATYVDYGDASVDCELLVRGVPAYTLGVGTAEVEELAWTSGTE